jgi:putative peptide zinc metalloprotease protein
MESLPKFRTDLIPSRHTEADNRRTIILKDPVSEKFYRLSPFEYEFLRKLDGTRTLEEALEAFRATGHYCSLEDAKLILGRAAQMGLVLRTKFSTAQFQRHLKERIRASKRAQRFSSVYFLFVPLVNPDRFLERTLYWFKALANKWTAVLLALLVPGAIYLLITGIPRIRDEYLFFFNLENLIYLWVTIALTKLVHELAHAYTAKSFGLHVPQMGIGFLIFFPCLFCNTTEAWQLADRKQRIAISAAGIMAEAAIAIVSTYIWYFSRPGMVNSLTFYLTVVSFVSTVLFNGNPLMKFDGYFILMDYLGIPNLRTKSLRYLRYLFMNRVLGVNLVPNPATNRKEGSILTAYGISAFIYLVSLYIGIAVSVYYRFDKTLGILLAITAFTLFVVRPLIKGIRSLYANRSEIHMRPMETTIFVILAAAVIVPLLVPISSKSVYPCYVASANIQKITIPLQTWVANAFVEQWDRVPKGYVLFELDASRLRLALIKKQCQRDVLEMQVELLRLDPKERGKAEGKLAELYHMDYELGRIKEDLRIAQGGIVAPFDGAITTLDYRMQPGFQPGEGAVVGELQSVEHCVIHALVPEQDRHKVEVGQEVEIWLPVGGGLTMNKRVDAIRPYGKMDLRDSPFSSRLGGELATEVKAESRRDVPLVAQYKCSVFFVNAGHQVPLGMTGRVVVSSPPKSIASRFLDRIVRTFSREMMF